MGKISTSLPLYSLFVRLYALGIHLAGFFNRKAKKWSTGRKNWKKRVAEIGARCKNGVWIHCASLGEYEMARPLIDKILERKPGEKIVVSFFSPSGYEHARLRDEVEKFYLPPDTKVNARYCIEHLRPGSLIFVKYDLWFNLIGEAHSQDVPLYLFNFHPSPTGLNQPFYGNMLLQSLRKFSGIYTLNQSGYDLLSKDQTLNLQIGGDTRFNNVLNRVKKDKGDAKLEKFSENFDCVFVCGSIWKADWEILNEAIHEYREIGWIVAPHEVEMNKIRNTIGRRKANYLFYSSDEVEAGNKEKNVLVLDCIGKLAAAYRHGFAAYVGGGFGSGLHNILEPAAYGIPVAFGPKHRRFPEATQFIESNIGREVQNPGDFQNFVNETMSGEKYLFGKSVIDEMNYCAGRSENMLHELVEQISNRGTKAN